MVRPPAKNVAGFRGQLHEPRRSGTNGRPKKPQGHMTNDTKYNGYKNYETWCVTLWLENDQATYEYWREQARRQAIEAPQAEQVLKGYWSSEQAAKFLLADQLKSEFEETNPLEKADVWSDLLNAALDAVDWHEVAGQFLTDFPEVDAEPTERVCNAADCEETSAVPLTIDLSQARFPLGLLVITPGAMSIIRPPEVSAAVTRHACGDWGLVCPEDAAENNRSLTAGARLLSAYDTSQGERFWIITEADRSSTTVLLPDEY